MSYKIYPLSQSLQDKISDVSARPEQGPGFKDEVALFLIFSGKSIGVAAGFIAIILALPHYDLLTGNVEVIVARIWQIVAGFLVSYCEAQCCCMEHVQKLCDMVDQRPLWNRALAYVALAVMPIILDKGVITIVGNLLIFITGVIYGMAALVTKADRQDMAAAAVGSPSMATSPGMVGGGNIGNTDHHTTLMEDPDVWRPT